MRTNGINKASELDEQKGKKTLQKVIQRKEYEVKERERVASEDSRG
jgi:hypothetical protein